MRRNCAWLLVTTGTLTLKSPLPSNVLVDSTVQDAIGSATLVELDHIVSGSGLAAHAA